VTKSESPRRIYWADDPDAPEMIRPYLIHAERRRLMTDVTTVIPVPRYADSPTGELPAVTSSGRHRLPIGFNLTRTA
jgi:hypothetical protein